MNLHRVYIKRLQVLTQRGLPGNVRYSYILMEDDRGFRIQVRTQDGLTWRWYRLLGDLQLFWEMKNDDPHGGDWVRQEDLYVPVGWRV